MLQISFVWLLIINNIFIEAHILSLFWIKYYKIIIIIIGMINIYCMLNCIIYWIRDTSDDTINYWNISSYKGKITKLSPKNVLKFTIS